MPGQYFRLISEHLRNVIDHAPTNASARSVRRRLPASGPWRKIRRIDAMLWAFSATVSMGLSLGFWLPPPALIAASGVTVVICLSVAPFTELEPATAVGMTFALVGVLQVGYLAGLMLSCAWLMIRLSRTFFSGER
jgi:hypothetical protein